MTKCVADCNVLDTKAIIKAHLDVSCSSWRQKRGASLQAGGRHLRRGCGTPDKPEEAFRAGLTVPLRPPL